MKRTKKMIGIISIGLCMTANILPAYAFEGKISLEPAKSVLISEKVSDEEKKEETRFVKFEGEITKVNATEKYLSIRVDSKNETGIDQMVFNISENLYILKQDDKTNMDREELEEGAKVDVFYRKDAPMTMSLPPSVNPDLLIVKDSNKPEEITHGIFDEELINREHNLKLNVSDDTLIINHKGEKLKKEDIISGELIGFYTYTTRSIPAQTTPQSIVVLDYQLAKGIINKDEYINEKYNLSFKIPPLWENHYKLFVHEDNVSPIKLQVDFRFEPQGHFLEMKENIVSIFVIEKDKFDDEFKKKGFVEVFQEGDFVYTVKIPLFSMYQRGELGELRKKMMESLDGINDLLTPYNKSSEDALMMEVVKIINEDGYYKEGTSMMPLRKIAAHMGYEVEWNGANRSILLKKGNRTFSITIGQKAYGYHKSLRQFEIAPEIKENKTYVPQSFVDMLK